AEQLAEHAATPGTKRGANRHLFRAYGCTRKKEVRNVHAGNEQNQADEPEKNRGNHGPCGCAPRFRTRQLFRDHVHLDALVRVRIFGTEPVSNYLECSACLRDRNARLQMSKRAHLALVASVENSLGFRTVGDRSQRRVRVGFDDEEGSVKFLRRHADDRHRMAVEVNGLADYAGIAIETPYPVRIAKNKNWILS